MMKNNTMYVDADEISRDWGCSKSKAYSIIRELSDRMRKENPKLIVIAGKVNRAYYEEACMKKND